ncbi:hypothetical protein AMAG_07999 [Allomyces macrogynus ATCC 38327]|uniref:Uncharacterized protein n=1 Tax=Allomyces macrogynus (strain ATCC 38327) TaxID=578462 RepID=A0A0L0SK22_ALLM3|nr:hypothetical protein AMAG_07999 [Allomyces macrogynus ATCC 38327]|eukprot:KNE62823.1 hypothetical protein AMAG_07999 [Allomyces macrogynus ATCC 38327]
MSSNTTLPAAGAATGPPRRGHAALAEPELLMDLRIRFVEAGDGTGLRVELLEPTMTLSMGLGVQPAPVQSVAAIAPLGGQIDASRPPQGRDMFQQHVNIPAQIKNMLLAQSGGGALLSALAPPVAASPPPSGGLTVTDPAANSTPQLQQEQQRPRGGQGKDSACTAPSFGGVAHPDCVLALPRPDLGTHDQADQTGGWTGLEPRSSARISRPRSRSRGRTSVQVDRTLRNDRSFTQSWSRSPSRSRLRSWSRERPHPRDSVARDENSYVPAHQQRMRTSRSWSRSQSRSCSREREWPRRESRFRTSTSRPARSPARPRTDPSFSAPPSRPTAPVAPDTQTRSSSPSPTTFEFRLSNLSPFETPGDTRRFESLFTSLHSTAKIRRAKGSRAATLQIDLLPDAMPRKVAVQVLRRSGYVIGGLPVRVQPLDPFSQQVAPAVLNLTPLVVYLAVNPPQYPETSSVDLNREIYRAFGLWPYMDRGQRPVPGTRLRYMFLTFDAPRAPKELRHRDEWVAFGCKMRFSRIEDPRAFFTDPKNVFDCCTALVLGDPDLAPLLNEDERIA